MTFSKYKDLAGKLATKQIEEVYDEAENKKDVDYWTPLSNIIYESIELRDSKGITQSELAKIMKTRQSAISRFENMGRIPNYDFIARLSFSLNQRPGITLFGDYMGIVPLNKQLIVKRLAEKENLSTQKFVQKTLEQGIDTKIKINNSLKSNMNCNYFSASGTEELNSSVEIVNTAAEAGVKPVEIFLVA